MSNSRKLVPRKINSTIFFPEKIQKWHEKLVNYKKSLSLSSNISKFAKINSTNFSKITNSRKLIPRKINSAKINSANINSAKINSAKINPFKVFKHILILKFLSLFRAGSEKVGNRHDESLNYE